jgi:hypothetical protein
MKKILVLLAVLGSAIRLSATPCNSTQWSLQHQTDMTVEGATWSYLTMDYDEDGKTDLITHESNNSGDGTLFARRGLGDGTFAAPITVAEHAATSPAAYDLDGNGHVDLVVAANGRFNVYAGLGTTAGFAEQSNYFPNYYVTRVEVGNFDSDPAPEMLALGSSNNLFVLYDYSGGVFVESQRVTTGSLPTFATMADFDNDGRQDVVVGERIPETISVFFRNANGTFAAPVILPAGDFPYKVAVGDIDGDGLRDFVSSHWTEGTVRVYRNAGSRQFTQTSLTIGAPGPYGSEGGDVRLLDLDADTHLDIVTAGINGSAGITTFMGVGNGTFRTPTWSMPSPFTSGGVTAIGIGNFDGNAVPDLVAASAGTNYFFSASCATQVYAIAKSRTISVGQDAILDVAISGFDATPPVDRGTVSSEGASTPVAANGRASLHVPDLAVGTHQLTVAFSGNVEVSAASSEPVEIVVTSQVTTTTLSVPPTQPVYGTPWSVIVSINSTFNSPLSEFTLLVDGVGTTHNVNNGAVPLNLEPGPHTIQARYEGSYGQPPSESDEVSVVALKATPTITPTGALTVRLGSAHSLQFTVAGSAQTTTPTGTLQLIEGTTILATLPLVNGAAAFSQTLQRGAHDVQLFYSGDSKFNSKTMNLTLQVLGTTPLAIEARGLPAAMHIAYLAPDNTNTVDLYRRVAGTVSYDWVPSWNSNTGIDPTPLTRGVVYEYVLLASLSNGSTINSNVDSAMLFTDDTLASGTKVKLAHFVELRQAVNEMRGAASLAPFSYPAGFGAGSIVRASHFNALSAALGEARNALGMAPATLPTVTAGTTKIFATSIQKLREAAR